MRKHGDPGLTILTYSEFLALHAKDLERSDQETSRYLVLGDKFQLHGRPELRTFERKLVRVPCRYARRGRAPRSRRVRASRRAGAPSRSSDSELDEPPPAVIFAHAAAWRGDPRVALWLEAWAEELLEGRS